MSAVRYNTNVQNTLEYTRLRVVGLEKDTISDGCTTPQRRVNTAAPETRERLLAFAHDAWLQQRVSNIDSYRKVHIYI